MALKSILKATSTPNPSLQPKGGVVVPQATSQARAIKHEQARERLNRKQQVGEDENDSDATDEQDEIDDEEVDDSDEHDGDDESDEDELTANGKRQRSSVNAGPSKPKKLKNPTLKPTPAPAFSQALTHLLSLPPTNATLAPKVAPPSAHAQRLDRRARSVLRETKAHHLARGHVPDVIAGWGTRPALPFSLWESSQARDFERARAGGASSAAEVIVETGAEREKRLRKLAQRGVVRLFNAIGAAQGVPDRLDREDAKLRQIQSKAAVAAQMTANPGGQVTRQPNVLGGRGKGEALSNLSKQSFLDLVRAGTT